MSDYALLAVPLRCCWAWSPARPGSATSSATAAGADRRRLRETPHYMLGLNFLVDNQVDQAVED